MSYDINYNDKRFQEVETEKQQALTENEQMYDGMVSESEKYYQAQIDASKEWEKTQSKLQQEKTDFAIEQIEQQKEQEQKDYTREQSGAYVDWQKESNRYSANAEQMASAGLTNSGYSESSQVSMYNTYQNRVATARESFNKAILNYNNAITEARLQNNSVLAEIAYEALQQQLELSLQGFQYKNQLLLEQANKKTEIENIYHNRYQDVLNQINTENTLAEEVRQFNAQMAEEQRQYNASLALQQAKASSSGSSGGGNSSGGLNELEIKKDSDNPVDTRLELKQVMPSSTISKLELDGKTKVVKADGKYYAKDGDGNYIDLSPLENTIQGVLRASSKTNNRTNTKN